MTKFSKADQDILEEIMLSRRDVRGNHFINTPLHDDVISKILLSASSAPSVGFSQPWQFVVIKDTQIKEQIAANFKQENKQAEQVFSDEKQALYHDLKLEGILEAPVNIAVFYSPEDGPVLGQTSMPEMGEYSVVCAIQNMWLMARALNVGIGWVSILEPETVKKILHVPENNKLVAYLCVGYVDQFLKKPELELNKWKTRKELSSVVHLDSYSNKNPLDD